MQIADDDMEIFLDQKSSFCLFRLFHHATGSNEETGLILESDTEHYVSCSGWTKSSFLC